MHKRAIIALAVAALSLGAAAYAADSGSSDRMDRTGQSVESSVDTTKSDTRQQVDRSRSMDPLTPDSRGVEEDVDNRGARTGGYLAAGIGIAALIGLFASRRSRDERSDKDDFNPPSGSPRV